MTTSIQEIESLVIDELKIELEIEENDTKEIRLLEVKVKNAVREIANAFNFKPWHEEDFIISTLDKHFGNIKQLAMYDYCKIGAEGQSEHQEKNISRVYNNRESCFVGIVPYAD